MTWKYEAVYEEFELLQSMFYNFDAGENPSKEFQLAACALDTAFAAFAADGAATELPECLEELWEVMQDFPR